jgi:hypothetical protein
MKTLTIAFLIFLPLSLYALEKDYQRPWRIAQGGTLEYRLDDQTRVDCLLPEYAVEVEFAHKWAESIGQSLFYAMKTDRKPGILLIVGEKDQRFIDRLTVVCQKYGIKLWTVKAK